MLNLLIYNTALQLKDKHMVSIAKTNLYMNPMMIPPPTAANIINMVPSLTPVAPCTPDASVASLAHSAPVLLL